uniref:NUP160 C-terminal TPR domain-containing protein n=1 Tax=Ditylenchus dipsaci TaxID=166011 RepID=A0A915CV28_9BILA
MYEYASRLDKEIYSKAHLKKRCDALAVVVVSLKLMEQHEKEEELRREQIIADARLELSDLNQSSTPPVETQDILRGLIKHQRYDSAMIIYCELKLPPYDLLEEVAYQSILVDRYASDTKEYQNFSAYNTRLLETIKGSESRMHWRLIRSYVELSRKHWPYDAKILRTVAVVFLKFSLNIPAWLVNHYKTVNFGDFLCSLVEFGDLTEAFNHLSSELDVAMKKVSIGNSHDAILPYTHIDWLLVLAGKESARFTESINEVKQKLSKLWNLSETLRNN